MSRFVVAGAITERTSDEETERRTVAASVEENWVTFAACSDDAVLDELTKPVTVDAASLAVLVETVVAAVVVEVLQVTIVNVVASVASDAASVFFVLDVGVAAAAAAVVVVVVVEYELVAVE